MIKKVSRCRFVRNFIFILAIILSVGAASIVSAKNSIAKVNMKEIATIKSNLTNNKDLLYVEFDAKDWKKGSDFFKDFGIKMKFPSGEWYEKIWNFDMFLDLMRDLFWIKDGTVSIFIKDLSKLNCGSKKTMCERIVKYFKVAILPYWEGEPNTDSVVDCCPGMKPKKFNVYYT